jgi:ABC-type multidrug transport system ATPase subunit
MTPPHTNADAPAAGPAPGDIVAAGPAPGDIVASGPVPGGIVASGLGLSTSRGWVYCDVDLAVPAGSLAVISGPAGCGKTALLLSLAGRMRPTAGALRVGECDVVAWPQRARRLVGLGETAGVNGLDETLTVAAQIRAELALHSRRVRRELHGPVDAGQRGPDEPGRPGSPGTGRHASRDVAAVLAAVNLDLDPRVKVGDLSAPARLLLGVALACVGRPPFLVVDDLHEDLSPADHDVVLARLRALADDGVTVVAGSLDPALAAHADVALELGLDGRPVTPALEVA